MLSLSIGEAVVIWRSKRIVLEDKKKSKRKWKFHKVVVGVHLIILKTKTPRMMILHFMTIFHKSCNNVFYLFYVVKTTKYRSQSFKDIESTKS